MSDTALDLAGFATNQRLVADEWLVPHAVEAETDHLVWDSESLKRARASRTQLQQFRRLADAPPAQIARFASRFGTLGRGRAALRTRSSGREPIYLWRVLSREADQILQIAAQLRDGRRALDPSVWSAFETMHVRPMSERLLDATFRRNQVLLWPLKDSWFEPEQLVAFYVGAWLRPVATGFAWSGARGPRLLSEPSSLVGALGLHLAGAITGGSGVAIYCRNPDCHAVFAPSHGNQRYCDRCKEVKEPARRATRAMRARRRAARDDV